MSENIKCSDCDDEITENNLCKYEGKECGLCNECCTGHCITCGGSHWCGHADSDIAKCSLCKRSTHYHYGYCESGFECSECGNIYCEECSGDTESDGYKLDDNEKICRKCIKKRRRKRQKK